MEGMEGVPKRRRTAEACTTDIDGISEQLQSVSLAISAAMDHGRGKDVASESGVPGHRGMEELRIWYQTEVFAATDAPQQRWEERRWAFLGQLQHALRNPLTHTAFLYAININESGSPSLADCGASASSAFGGLLFVGRSRYNDIVIADETVSRVHCIIVRSVGSQQCELTNNFNDLMQAWWASLMGGLAMAHLLWSVERKIKNAKSLQLMTVDRSSLTKGSHSLFEYVQTMININEATAGRKTCDNKISWLVDVPMDH